MQGGGERREGGRRARKGGRGAGEEAGDVGGVHPPAEIDQNLSSRRPFHILANALDRTFRETSS